MDAVEQDWRQQYKAGYPNMRMAAHVPMQQGSMLPYDMPYMNPGYPLSYVPMPEREYSRSRIMASNTRLIPGEPKIGVSATHSRTGVLLMRSAVLFFAGLLGVVFIIVVALVFTGQLYGSSGDDVAGAGGNEAAQNEPKLKLDAPRAPGPPPVTHAKLKRKHKASRHEESKHARHRKAKTTTPGNKHVSDVDEDEEDRLNAIPPAVETRSGCRDPNQTYCEVTKHSYFYRFERDVCDSTFQNQVFVCNRSPNRFMSLKACKSSCIEATPPLPKCQEQPVFTKCNSGDLKRSYWYREGKKCVEWEYPDGYCASKLRGSVARSKQECRKKCLGPDTDDQSCTMPAELTCRTGDMKFPYFAHTFPNGTVACLKAEAELLRPHRCMVGENAYPSHEECRRACSREAIFFPPPSKEM